MSPGAPAGESAAAADAAARARTRAGLACAANLLALAIVVWLGPALDVLLACAVVLGGFALLWLREARRAAQVRCATPMRGAANLIREGRDPPGEERRPP